MDQIGKKIEQLRIEKGLSRPQFCGDESVLSVRQLARIEAGESNPTLIKLEFIAERLGIPQYTLVPDYQPLDKRYLELKHYLLKQPPYNDEALKQVRESFFDEIFEKFYENLPDEERLVVDVLQSIHEINESDNAVYGEEILEEYLPRVLEQKIYSINDLLLLKLYFFSLYFIINFGKGGSSQDEEKIKYLSKILLRQEDDININELFVLRDVILSLLLFLEASNRINEYPQYISLLYRITERDRDYQKKPIIIMLEWKYALAIEKDMTKATEKYQQAKLLAEMLDLAPIVKGLDYQWQIDLKKYL